MTFGLAYCVVGEAFVKAFEISYKSTGTRVPAMVLTDAETFFLLEPLAISYNFDLHLVEDFPDGFDANQKVRHMKFSVLPKVTLFDTTIYCDVDTVCLSGDLSKHLSGFQTETVKASICRFSNASSNYISEAEKQWMGTYFPNSIIRQCGVYSFANTETVRDFFEIVYAEWLRFKKVDQPAFSRALTIAPMVIDELPIQFNFPYPWLSLENLAIFDPVIMHVLGSSIENGKYFEVAKQFAGE
jgi:hypothetical protein